MSTTNEIFEELMTRFGETYSNELEKKFKEYSKEHELSNDELDLFMEGAMFAQGCLKDSCKNFIDELFDFKDVKTNRYHSYCDYTKHSKKED